MKTSEAIINNAKKHMGENDLLIEDAPGMLGPILFSPNSSCGLIEKGIGIEVTHRRMDGDLVLAGGAISRSDARRLHGWLGNIIKTWN